MTTFIQFDMIEGRFGPFGQITLNRPEALNALNLEMIQAMNEQLIAWEEDTHIQAVIIQSNSEKAFCAGGDIRALYEAGLKKEASAITFFQQEYALNYRIHAYAKPYISFLNGITMGGGVGISLHGSHRIAGENFRFAMPETAIGFFPDIGGSYLLNHCPGSFGMYLGLTGARVNQNDAFALNLTDYSIPVATQQDVKLALYDLDLRMDAHEQVSAVLDTFHNASQHNLTTIYETLPWVNDVFSQSSVENIMSKLSEWAQTHPLAERALLDLQLKSPLSLKITFELLKRMRNQSLAVCLKTDEQLAHQFFAHSDFYEGVRALIIDKDNSPQWKPKTLVEISPAMVNAYFV